MERIRTMADFWPYYLSEHRVPLDRRLHFVGTTWFFLVVIACFALQPLYFSVAAVVAVAVTWFGATRLEPTRPAFWPMLVMLIVCTAACPLFLSGVVGAYTMAWIGHFIVEKNRPATFKYPVWSFLMDFRMWGQLVQGRLWTGDSVEAQRAA